MFNEKDINQIIAGAFIVVLLIFSFFLLRPIFFSVIFGLILAYTFSPLNNLLIKAVKNRTVAASITCLLVLIILFITIWFFIPLLVMQIFDSYLAIQSLDLISSVKEIFPLLFSSQQVSATITSAYNTFLSNLTKISMEKLTEMIGNLPILAVKSMIVLIVFFYSMRDGNKLIEIMTANLPFRKELTHKFIKKSKDVTFSVIFGTIVAGILTGVATGIGLYFAGVKNALLLTVISIIVAILPIIGTWIVWVPVVIGLFIAGNVTTAILLALYCIVFVTIIISGLLHAEIVSKKSGLPISLTIIGVFGGIFAFGGFGIIIGPLIIAYLLVLFEIYKEYNPKVQQ